MHTAATSPVLEFVKCITHIISLDSMLADQVRVLKKNLLDLLGTKSFSVQAQFVNPCEMIPPINVICEYCNFSRDLDFCRDANLLPTEEPGPVGNQIVYWSCLQCSNIYDRVAIEEALIEVVHNKAISWQVQDLQCTRCHTVKPDQMSDYCKCSGSYAEVMSREDWLRKLTVYKNLARIHNLSFLWEIVDFYITRG